MRNEKRALARGRPFFPFAFFIFRWRDLGPALGCRVRTGGRACRRGATLVELVVSMAAATILMGGLASAVVLATRALPENRGVLENVTAASQVGQQVAADLGCAMAVLSRSARLIEFQVPDRNGDGDPETIRYAWSGTAGDPLYRQYNGNTAVAVLDNVGLFQLDYETVLITTTGDATENESGETELRSYNASTSLSDFKIKNDKWCGEYFRPNLPSDAISWKITRVVLMAAREGPANGVATVELRGGRADQRPDTNVLASAPLLEATLPSSYVWHSVAFADTPALDPNARVCVLVRHVADADACKLRYRGGSVTAPNQALLTTSTGGTSWTVETDKSLLYYVYGTVTTPGPPEVIVTQYLTRARVTLRVGSDDATRVETSAQVFNTPVLP